MKPENLYIMEPAERMEYNCQRQNETIRDDLINKYIPYVKRIVYRVAIHLPSNIVETDDLINAGVIGLIQAVDRYDPEKNNKFTTYAVYRIKGAVLSELRSRDFLSRSTRRKIRELEKTYLKMEKQLGRDVDDDEIASELGIQMDQLYQIKKMASISFVSFEDFGYSTYKEQENVVNCLNKSNMSDALTLLRLKEIKGATAIAIKQLPEKEKLVLAMYYQDGLTMKEVGEALAITESRVSQIHSQAIIHLREKLRIKGVLDD